MTKPVTTKTPAELVEAYIKLRDKKDAAKEAFDASIKPTTEIMAMLENLLLEKLTELGVDSLTAKGVGTVYRNTKDSCTVKDKAAFRAWVEETGNWDLLDLKANKTIVRKLLDAGEEVPGVKFSSMDTVGVRRN